MGHYITKYIKGCDLFNCTKTFLTAPMGKLMPNRVPDHRWQVISVDLITELPQSHGYDALLVVVNHLSKRTHVGGREVGETRHSELLYMYDKQGKIQQLSTLENHTVEEYFSTSKWRQQQIKPHIH